MKKFTLVEILVVIAVIGILASLILPAVTGANQQTMRLKAKADVSNIMSAIVKYESTYGKLPILMDGTKPNSKYFEDGDEPKKGRLTKEGYYALIQALSGVDLLDDSKDVVELGDDYINISDTTDNTSDWAKGARAMNPRKTPFLDVPSDFPKNGFVDPWDNEYVIVLDYEVGAGSSDKYGDTDTLISAYDKIIEHPALEATFDGKNITCASKSGMLEVTEEGTKVETQIPAQVRANILVYSMGPDGVDDGGLDVTVTNSFDDINSWSELQ